MKLLSSDDVLTLVTIDECMDFLKVGFKSLHQSSLVAPQRTIIHAKDSGAVLGAMPIYDPLEQSYVVKIAAYVPQNTVKGKNPVNALIALQKTDTGEIELLMDGNTVTGLRTGAMSGVVTDHLAKKDAKNLVIIGSGFQAFYQLRAMLAVRQFEKISICSRSPQNVHKFISRAQVILKPNAELLYQENINKALIDADVVCTATTSSKPLFDHEAVLPGLHINAVGMHTRNSREVPNSTMEKSLLVVEDVDAAVIEAGECHRGAISVNTLLNSERSNQKYSVFSSVGTAYQDLFLAEGIARKVRDSNLGLEFNF